MRYKYIDAAAFFGKTITEIKQIDNSEIHFTADGKRYKMLHEQDCCESVSIESISGDLQSIVGSPLIQSTEEQQRPEVGQYDDSVTISTFVLATKDSRVVITWRGESNGYYSETVQIEEIE